MRAKTCIEGSNPSVSAKTTKPALARALFFLRLVLLRVGMMLREAIAFAVAADLLATREHYQHQQQGAEECDRSRIKWHGGVGVADVPEGDPHRRPVGIFVGNVPLHVLCRATETSTCQGKLPRVSRKPTSDRHRIGGPAHIRKSRWQRTWSRSPSPSRTDVRQRTGDASTGCGGGRVRVAAPPGCGQR
jgi:hypothetical protein